MLAQAGQILIGHVNEVLKLEQELYDLRKPICNECILKTIILKTEVCNPNLYVNLESGETSIYPKPNFKNGCGCRLEASTRVKHKKCPLGKW